MLTLKEVCYLKLNYGSWHWTLFIGHLTLLLQTTLIIYARFFPSTVLFNMHDTDNDGTITLEEYKHVRHKHSTFIKHKTCVTLHAIFTSFSEEVTEKQPIFPA